MDARTALRQQIRAKRQALSSAEIKAAAEQLGKHISLSRIFQNSHHIAFYLANDGETNLMPLLQLAWRQKKCCYLPVLGFNNSRSLWFLPYYPHTPLETNRFGIPEPVHARNQRLFKPQSLDLILMPLVAFDKFGNRLGMGGGFYDRTLAFLLHRQQWRKPKLIGTAYEFQRTKTLSTREWDVPLDGVATENGLVMFHNTSRRP